jgi:hypothetical protein
LQQPFRKLFAFNGLLVGACVLLAYLPLRSLPDRKARPEAFVALVIRSVGLVPTEAPLHMAGAWQINADDPRFAGLSGLALDGNRFLAVSDLGAVVRFDKPTATRPSAMLQDLGIGPGSFGNKWSRDAESIARDPRGRGWWVGYEQNHSLWLYDATFIRGLANVSLAEFGWSDNRGGEGLLAGRDKLLVTGENGRDAIEVESNGSRRVELKAGADVADAAVAPDGSRWLLLRRKSLNGIDQSIAPLIKAGTIYRAGPGWPLPKGALDNFEGMAIEPLADGRWRFWLITDDGHRIMARTLLVALDYRPPSQKKSPATSAGPSKLPSAK